MGKGSAPRPFAVDQDVYSANWSMVFGDAKIMGSGVTGSASVSTTEGSRSSLDSPATVYLDNSTMQIVDEDHWPEPLTPAHAAVEGAE